MAQHIDSYAESIFSNLKDKKFYIEQTGDQLINSLVELFGDINALHPFREGNGDRNVSLSKFWRELTE